MSVATLAAVVSRQHIPTILSVLHFEPARLLLVLTQEMYIDRQDETLLAALADAGKPFQPEQIKYVQLPPQVDAFSAIRRIEEGCIEPPNVVNVSSGTKPLSGALLAAANTWKSQEVIYVDADAPDQFIDQRTGVSHSFRHRVELATFLTAHRARMTRSQNPTQQMIDAAAMLVATNRRSFRASKQWVPDGETDPEKLFLSADELRLSIADREQLVQTVQAMAPHFRDKFVSFQWLEFFFFALLQRVQAQLAITDLQMNCTIRWTDNDALSNELDVVFMRGNTFWSVECKSGDWIKSTRDAHGVVRGGQKEKCQSVLCQIAGRNAQFHSIGARCLAALTHHDSDEELAGLRAAQLGLQLAPRKAIETLHMHYAANNDAALANELKDVFGWTA